jgi:hypothetical protein
MPPRVARLPSGRATVNQNHPAATAAAAAARVVAAGKTRTAKTLANKKISEICHHNPRTAVAVEAPDDAQATAGVTVDFTAKAATGVTFLDAVVPAKNTLVAALPPMWNAWWCGACTALHFVGDGGELRGPCLFCQVRNPICNHVMLDPDKREELRSTPGLAYQTILSGVAYSPPSRGVKTSGISSPNLSSQDSSLVRGDSGLGDLSFSPDDEEDDDFEEYRRTKK